MKKFWKILILCILSLCLFLLIDQFSLIKIPNSVNRVLFNSSLREEISARVDIPGALKVINNITNQDNNAHLDKNKIIQITNSYRKENGNLVELIENNQLDFSAEEKLNDMFDQQYFEHISPSGKGVGNLAEDAGYEYILLGENLALGNFKDEDDLVLAWMNSSGHRANILNSHYTQIGVAIGKGKFDGKNVWIAVQHFATPREVCPSISQDLYNKIINDKEQINELEDSLISKKKMIVEGVFDKGSSAMKQIKEYNSSVVFYNNLIKQSKEEVKKYNNQISAFNECVSSYEL